MNGSPYKERDVLGSILGLPIYGTHINFETSSCVLGHRTCIVETAPMPVDGSGYMVFKFGDVVGCWKSRKSWGAWRHAILLCFQLRRAKHGLPKFLFQRNCGRPLLAKRLGEQSTSIRVLRICIRMTFRFSR